MFGDAEVCRQASPLNHILGQQPPFLLLLAEQDIPNCLEYSKEMVAALRERKGAADYVLFKDRNHGTIVGNIPNDNDPVAAAIVTFIAKHSGAKLEAGK